MPSSVTFEGVCVGRSMFDCPFVGVCSVVVLSLGAWLASGPAVVVCDFSMVFIGDVCFGDMCPCVSCVSGVTAQNDRCWVAFLVTMLVIKVRNSLMEPTNWGFYFFLDFTNTPPPHAGQQLSRFSMLLSIFAECTISSTSSGRKSLILYDVDLSTFFRSDQ